MHSFMAYSIKIHDKLLPGPLSERYHKLDNVRSKDVLDFVGAFLETLKNEVHNDTEGKKTVRVVELSRDSRDVYGWIEYGEYGIPGRIYSTSEKENKYEKKHDDSDVVSLYYHFRIPVDSQTGIAIFHTAGNKGVKTFVATKFNEYFKNFVGLSVQMPPLAHEGTVKRWLEGSKVKEIRLGRYRVERAGSDVADLLGVDRAEVTLKPKRGRSFGSFTSFKNKKTDDGEGFVEILSELSSEVKAVIESEGRTKVVSLRQGEPVSTIEITSDNVTINDGAPHPQSLHNYAKILMSEFERKVMR
ncbi:hypothetical protein NPS34_14530 [Pseudomonas putida]|uniref:Uncharacterized protein n=1 Tax=Pseudomonas putida (strain ATCC 700007 / DSM 6899 / JCM 31910 / BCRC 17059 / LMG 24140 / F1) TaxID=351746 RepID=A5VY85_PSEP1|nr:hypothetical protein [Pseudomonas putida]MDD1999260.1 hypothetical protein [Pseudomonas putida]HDS1790382.1 hypothetical protein [Pseudomonas putida]